MLSILFFLLSFPAAQSSEVRSQKIRDAVEQSINQIIDQEHRLAINEEDVTMTILGYVGTAEPEMLVSTHAQIEIYDPEFGDPMGEVELFCNTRLKKISGKWRATNSRCEVDGTGDAEMAISPEAALEVARGYAINLGPSVLQFLETPLSDQLSVTEPHGGRYTYVLHDQSGDCGIFIVVNANGDINERDSDEDWKCI